MRKYAEVLNEKRIPLTGEELDNATAEELLAEVKHLREMMATAYMWIGRPAPHKGKVTRAYTECMKEAYRIYKEMKQ